MLRNMQRGSWAQAVWTVCLVMLFPPAVSSAGAARQEEQPKPIPVEEYPIYDRVVVNKFLTSRTGMVVIRRLTATRLVPMAKEPPDRIFFEKNDFFGRALEADLITDFLYKTRRSWRLESRFDFGVPYTFATGNEVEGLKVSLAPIPIQAPPSPRREVPPPTLGVLEFSRVAFNRPESQALVYVGIDRPDRTGAGFLFWLHRTGQEWQIMDSEVLWVARP